MYCFLNLIGHYRETYNLPDMYYCYGEILHTSAVFSNLFMLDREYMSTGEKLHFLSKVCKWKVYMPTKRRKTKEMQVVEGPNSTGEGMNKINIGGKSRENCTLQF